MSRVMKGLDVLSFSFPRVSGDEPDIEGEFKRHSQFSPRERG